MIAYEMVKDFWKYLKYDEKCVCHGIDEKAPESAKKAYENYLKMQEEAKKKGIKL